MPTDPPSLAIAAPQSLESYGPAELDRRFRGPLMRFFLRRVGDHAEAEDLTQQVFVRILGRAASAAPAPLVFRIAANLLKDHGRSGVRRGRVFTVADVDDEPASAAEALTPERVLAGREELERTLAVLEKLGPRTRDIFILFRLEKMSHAEIAARLGISRSAVEKHVMKAAYQLLLARMEA
jgi:RNA polymerase sigma factor (sigma-70 family)